MNIACLGKIAIDDTYVFVMFMSLVAKSESQHLIDPLSVVFSICFRHLSGDGSYY